MISHVLEVGLIEVEHMQSVIKVFFFSKNCYYFSDLETQWPRNPELISEMRKWDFACLQQLSERVSHNIEEKKSQLCFRASALYDMVTPQKNLFAKLTIFKDLTTDRP